MKTHLLATVLLTLSGVFTQNPDYGVIYPDKLICAVRGFSVSLPCNYTHPLAAQVKQKLWCSMNSNSDKWCINPPYVYTSSSHTESNYQFIGDDTSNCTLLIRDVQLNYSGEYKFRFITNVEKGKYVGDPGVTLQVTDLKVALIRLSGNGTLKQGDSLNLTCDVNCTHTSSQFMWSKNNQPLNTSGRVLHFPNVTLKDSGNYTCTWETSLASGSNTISLQVEGVLPQDWGVKYPDNPICAVRGFTVSLPCYYYYPKEGFHVIQKLWCLMSSNTDQWCKYPPNVYNSSSNLTSDFSSVTDNQSDCTLSIHNVQLNYSGVYKFRFITNVTQGEYTGLPGVTLKVTDLKVALIRLSGNGTLKQGDSLNLTCDVNCTHTSSQFMWSKNNRRLPEPGRVLHFPALTAKDSGKYTCTWETNETSGYDTFSLHVEGGNPGHWPVDAVVTAVVVFIILVILGAVIYRMRRKDDAQQDNSGESGVQKQVKQLPQSNEEVSQQEELTYATVFIKNNHLNNGRVQGEKPKEDISVIYSTVNIK